ncbi:transcriptional regulator, LysR family [Oleidesulfovibrio alaskensis G20]|jgi:DNA-binding transcriptional LysR family regulator|uniref:Transcriptional regulator, LysR family n=1 Tax=Oleidesulfovibrio alaskensis (strain ATCC BAA-1058 / DSM 17464 / G20) TaxID=207559 RepID=Q30YF9_OLEA2|nr:LysR family transcriptional regulator [Oleidesulfovibrio alaskensis]ABB39287.2 transcriptional regulator, LysR family [Oleidesulfovibrio alaskensis G20]MBG0771967.1 LysR family transcriptional regulator [Oleidesulfovibrio alaskensis]MBL3581795.1 LysR family transcriptional regulator [Oleidesulfovibrio alaskensis]
MVQDFLNDVPLLVEVARQKSFSKAAEALGIGVSTLSRRIKLLEKRMGVLLFYRDTRNVELTDNGAYLLDRCGFVLEEVQKAYDSVVLNMQKPSGLVRVCMFLDLYDGLLKKVLLDFAARWPDISLELTFQDHPVDMRTAPFDVAFVTGNAIAPALVTRKLLTIEPFLYASPLLLERYPMPREPDDLHRMPCIVLQRFGGRWPMHNGSRQVTVDVVPRYSFSSVEMCRDFLLAGHGVALLRKERARPDEKAGRLVRLLPDWSGGFVHDVNLVMGSRQLPMRVRLFVDHVLAQFAP